MCLRRVSVSSCLVAILSCFVNVNFCMASDSIYNNAGTNDNVYKVIITPYFPADYLQSSFGLSGSIDIGSVNLLKLGSHLSFNISGHIGLSWAYKNNGTYCDVQDPDSDNNQSLIYETKSKMSYVFALVHPNISFLRDRISFGPLFGLKHVSHSITIGEETLCNLHTIAFVCGAQLRVMITRWIGLTMSYQYDLGLKNFTKDHNDVMRKIKYTNHNMITIGITFVPYSNKKIYTGITVSPFSFNRKTISLEKMSDDEKIQMALNYTEFNNILKAKKQKHRHKKTEIKK